MRELLKRYVFFCFFFEKEKRKLRLAVYIYKVTQPPFISYALFPTPPMLGPNPQRVAKCWNSDCTGRGGTLFFFL